MNDSQQQQHQQPVWSDPTVASTSLTEEIHEEQNLPDDSDFLTQPYSTLDEPVRETIMRDVRSVASKIKVVLLPLKKTVR
jgi:hypothetical protein